MHLNGWQRLWALASIFWIGAIAAVWYSTEPTSEYAAHHPAFYYQLTSDSRALLLPEGSHDHAVEVEMPNGYVLYFRSESTREDQQRIAREYYQIAVNGQALKRKEDILFYSLLAAMPCILLAALGWGVAWVRSGFNAHKIP